MPIPPYKYKGLRPIEESSNRSKTHQSITFHYFALLFVFLKTLALPTPILDVLSSSPRRLNAF